MHKAKLAAGLAVVLLAAVPGRAADTLRPGKWEYTVTTQVPNLPKLPPGIHLPPNIHIRRGAGGMTVTHTNCVTAKDPVGELAKPRPPKGVNAQCKVEKMDRHGGEVSWITVCTAPDMTVRSEGTAHFAGEQMEATVKTRTTGGQMPSQEVATNVKGRYLGACDK